MKAEILIKESKKDIFDKRVHFSHTCRKKTILCFDMWKSVPLLQPQNKTFAKGITKTTFSTVIKH